MSVASPRWGYVLALALVAASPISSQTPAWLLPGPEYIPHLWADPRDPTMVAKLVIVTQAVTQFGTGVEGEAGLGATIPLFVLEGSSTEDAFVMGLQGSVYGRFQMQEQSRDLVTSDWMFAIPFVLHRGQHWFRIRFLHVSSHLGDEYIERFDVRRVTDTQDALDGVAFFRLVRALGVYGGGSWAFNVDPNDRKRFTLRGGLQWYGPSLGAGFQLYGAADALFDQDVDWRPRLNTQAGVLIHAPHGRDARLAAEFLTGPSPQGQFDNQTTTHVTLGLYIDL